jgi:hypothetical protein
MENTMFLEMTFRFLENAIHVKEMLEKSSKRGDDDGQSSQGNK